MYCEKVNPIKDYWIIFYTYVYIIVMRLSYQLLVLFLMSLLWCSSEKTQIWLLAIVPQACSSVFEGVEGRQKINPKLSQD